MKLEVLKRANRRLACIVFFDEAGFMLNPYLHKHRRIVVEPFPQYAPELNPVDYVWGYVKCARLANYTPHNLVELRAQITKEFRRMQQRPDLLKSFFDHAGLTLNPRECYRESGQNDLKPAALSMNRRYLVFDIETAKQVVFEDSDWRRYRPLGICCATTLLEGEEQPLIWHGGTSQKRPTRQMKRRELLKLIEYLARKIEEGFTILTWNGVGFDFDVLAEESGESKLCRRLATEHVDMMFHILCRLGFGVALDSAARGMGIEGKDQALNSASAPVLWGKGMHEDVFRYVKRDVRTTLALGRLCETRGRIDWSTRNGKLRSLLIPKGWLTVKQAMKLPEPANAWLFDQWSRNKFTRWLD